MLSKKGTIGISNRSWIIQLKK